MSNGRATQITHETLIDADANALATQITHETLIDADANALATQITMEVLITFDPIKVTQLITEIAWRPYVDVPCSITYPTIERTP